MGHNRGQHRRRVVLELRALALADPAGKFSPYDGKWPQPLHAAWASDPKWENPGDGVAVASWRNGGSIGGDLEQVTAGNRPIFRKATAAFGNRSTLQFDGSNDRLIFDGADIPQPYKVIVVAQTTLANAAQAFMGLSGASARIGTNATTSWILVTTSTVSATPNDLNAHVWQGTLNGASSALIKDGTQIAAGNAGTGALLFFNVGTAQTTANPLQGHVAYAAVYDGAVSNTDLLALMRALGAFYQLAVA